ncbi:MAG: hypothetical protein DRN30_02895 [Thermoplasmata archaeon]|nr:MAG: hypothetical protein DRN30_02895 [Thermoplasmata archaeon]
MRVLRPYVIGETYSQRLRDREIVRNLIKERKYITNQHQIQEGRCGLCGKYDLVFPVTLTLCLRCGDKKLYYGTKRRIISFEKRGNCLFCGKKNLAVYYEVNTNYCYDCAFKVANIDRKKFKGLKRIKKL